MEKVCICNLHWSSSPSAFKWKYETAVKRNLWMGEQLKSERKAGYNNDCSSSGARRRRCRTWSSIKQSAAFKLSFHISNSTHFFNNVFHYSCVLHLMLTWYRNRGLILLVKNSISFSVLFHLVLAFASSECGQWALSCLDLKQKDIFSFPVTFRGCSLDI